MLQVKGLGLGQMGLVMREQEVVDMEEKEEMERVSMQVEIHIMVEVQFFVIHKDLVVVVDMGIQVISILGEQEEGG
jgi:hypothetical protein